MYMSISNKYDYVIINDSVPVTHDLLCPLGLPGVRFI